MAFPRDCDEVAQLAYNNLQTHWGTSYGIALVINGALGMSFPTYSDWR